MLRMLLAGLFIPMIYITMVLFAQGMARRQFFWPVPCIVAAIAALIAA